MFELFLWLLVPLIFTLVTIKVLTRWATRVVGRNIEAKMRAAEQLVNFHAIPEQWLAAHRSKFAALQARGADEQQIARVVDAACRDSLRRVDALIGYFGQGAFVDSPETRDSLVDALQAERQRMEEQDWRALLEPTSTRSHDH